jgi:Protein of unknown function (DUF1592)/Protein of unknown function (DUF1588)/Protein of unknown function (DUF1595)/Protein of unknown function (DUF1587)/Protein of unknown function (DUF1585)
VVRARWLALGATLALGCTGTVGDAGAPSGTGPSRQIAGGGASSSGAPPLAAGPNNGFIDHDSTALSRLTNAAYSQTVADVLGEPADAASRYGFPDDPRQHGFDNNAALLQVSATHSDRYAAAAEAIAAATFADPARRALVLTCDPASGEACLKPYVAHVGRRLYRRPLADAEVQDFVTLAASSGTASDPLAGPRTILEAMLQSPHFLYRVEIGVTDPARTDLVGLGGFELATRLSYLLLGTTPNEALLDKAQGGTLDTAEGVGGVVAALLADPRTRLGMRRFYGQWLPLTEISGPTAEAIRIPHMGDKALAADLVEETQRFADSVLWDSGTKVLDLLTAKYTFVNANLATLYGLPAPAQPWQRVDFAAGMPRAGILTQGSILAAGSHNGVPSNTRRGQMVREQLLCTDVPPPPPGVNANIPPPQAGETEQQTFKRHTTDASCSSCHSLMDPIGWGLSGFDAAGAVRTTDSNGQPLSAAGRIEGMTPPEFSGPVELGQKLATSPEFKACFARQLFRYTYGRVETAADEAGIAELEAGFEASTWSFGKGLTSLVTSNGFRYRNRGDAP